MTNTTGTLWIDVTLLINWSGHLTGIQRVEYNLAKRFAEQPNVKFCVFHKDQRKLVEFDFAHIAYKIEMLQHRDASTDVNVPEVTSFDNHAKRLLKRMASAVLSPEAKTRLRSRYQRLRRGASVSNGDPAIKLTKNDALLILSGDWSDNIFAGLVTELRTAHHCKVIQIVYDMLPAFFPGFFVAGMPQQFSDYMASILSRSDGILAISESTKHDVQRFMKQRGYKPVPVEVFRLGDDFVKQDPVKPDAPIKGNDYLLCVCTVEARKNHMLLYYAAREAQARGKKLPPIVVVGKRGWLTNDFFYLVENDPILSKQFIFLNCSDAELAWLYEHCRFTIFPSFYEGWGLPVAESLFYGKLCLSSNTSSMPEIAGGLIEYFSPNDPVKALEEIQYFLNDPKALAQKEKDIKARYKTTSWDQSFAQVCDFVQKISS